MLDIKWDICNYELQQLKKNALFHKDVITEST